MRAIPEAMLLIGAGVFVLQATPARAQDLIASFYDISASKFSVQAVSPKETIREYVICKAVWFAEKKQARTMSLGNPLYGPPKAPPQYTTPIPSDWLSVSTTIYLSGPNPVGNPFFSVADKAAGCRRIWPWYR